MNAALLTAPATSPSRTLKYFWAWLLLLVGLWPAALGAAKSPTKALPPPVALSHPSHPANPLDPDGLAKAGHLSLVDEVAGSEGAGGAHLFQESPEGASKVEEILGKKCRVLPNDPAAETDPKMFAWRIGAGKKLEAGQAYLLSIEYPEDQPRTVWVVNRGCETNRGFHTGTTVGDVLHGRYVPANPESLKVPLAGNFQQWRQFFFMQHRTVDGKLDRWKTPRPLKPEDGFWVQILQTKSSNQPLCAGAAVSRIRLFKVNRPDDFAVSLRLPPAELPRRYVADRNEMYDNVIDNPEPGTPDDATWFEYRARTLRFLGTDTLCKDLLEFGHNQGWMPNPDNRADGTWYNTHPFPDRWEKIAGLAERLGLTLLPYYEYYGSIGQDKTKAIGTQKRCQQLDGGNSFTDLHWCNNAHCDVTDPDFVAEAIHILDRTVAPYAGKVAFAGAWFRARLSAWPVSFSDKALGKFTAELKLPQPATRAGLKGDAALLGKYYEWWFLQRKAFLEKLRDHMQKLAGPQAVVLFTGDYTEGGFQLLPDKRTVVSDDPEAWRSLLALPENRRGAWVETVDFRDVVREDQHLAALLRWPKPWNQYEFHHACPPYDPDHYRDGAGALLTYSCNRSYTVASPSALERFRTQSGLAVVRNYSLNEDEMGDLTGYFASDMDYTGPFETMVEARSMAYGDPRYLLYLTSNVYNRGFPERVRAFNAAFLSLPALTSSVLESAVEDDEVVVREIPAGTQGTYYAVINPGLRDRQGLGVKLRVRGKITNAATGEALKSAAEGRLSLDLPACSMLALHVAGEAPKGASPEPRRWPFSKPAVTTPAAQTPQAPTAASAEGNVPQEKQGNAPHIVTPTWIPPFPAGVAFGPLAFKADNANAWSFKGALPQGMSFTPEGVLSGTPAQAGNFTFDVCASGPGGKDWKGYTLEVVAAEGKSKAPP